MTETQSVIDPQAVTFVRSSNPTSSVFYLTAQDQLRIDSGQAEPHARFRVEVPARREFVSAVVEVREDRGNALVGAFAARSVEPGSDPYRQMTWNTRPPVVAGSGDRPGAVSGRWLSFPVTADVAEALAAGRERVAFRFTATSTTVQWLRTATLRLVITTRPASTAPSDVAPAGLVGTLKPTFTWTAPAGVTKVQLQVSTTSDFAATVYDSGEQNATTPRWDTSTGPAWSGLSGTRFVRVRHFTAAGWSGWVTVTVTFSALTNFVVSNPAVVELARNLAVNSSFEVDASAWGGVIVTASRVTGSAKFGSSYLRMEATSVDAFGRVETAEAGDVPCAPGQSVTLSAYCLREVGNRQVRAVLLFEDAAGAVLATVTGPSVTPTTDWTIRSSVTAVAPANTVEARLRLQFTSTGAIGDRVGWDGVLAEVSAAPGDYFDGDTPDDEVYTYAWTGTPHASASTKSASIDADPTPPDVWSPAAQAVEIISYLDGVRLGTTGIVPGPISTLTPSHGAKVAGQVLKRVRRFYDGQARVAPPYVERITHTIYTPTTTVAGLTGLVATQVPDLPAVDVTWTRGSTPDEAALHHDAAERHLVPGTEQPFRDWTVPPNVDLAYGGRAVVNGKRSNTLTTDPLHTVVEGIWLVDPNTERGVLIAGTDGLDIGYGGEVVVHTPIDGAILLRRVLTRRGPEGTVSGRLELWPGRDRKQCLADVEWLAENTRELRLILGDLNIPVTHSGLQAIFDKDMFFTDRPEHLVSFACSHAGGT